MAAIILKIGNVDLSDVTEQEGVQIRSSPVFGEEFTNVKGIRRRKILGEQIDISASFDSLSEETAKKIAAVCNADSVTVDYLDPNAASADFERPSVIAAPEFEDSEGNLYWRLSISMTCPLKGNGL